MSTHANDPTGFLVVAYGSLLAIDDDDARAAALEEFSRDDPALHAQLVELLRHTPTATDDADGSDILTRFAAQPEPHPGAIKGGTDSAPHPAARAGSRIADFTLLELISRGGMGEVWRARQASPARDVALKLIPTSQRRSARASAVREPETLAALRHPAIATIHASGSEADLAWIAMELVVGARPITEATAALPLGSRVARLVDAADAIAHAHAAGFIHRDIKPSNILVDGTGAVKVIDFGIALPSASDRLADPLAWCGTPAYLPPEALDGDPARADARGDVYALGVVLHTMITGSLPAALSVGNPIALLRALRTVSFALPPDAPRAARGDLEAIVAKATARDPAQRYRTVDAFADDLRAYLAHRPVEARPRNAAGRARLAARRSPGAAALVALTFGALVSATAISTWYALYARQAAIEAGALASQAGNSYVAFIEVFFPQGLDPRETESISIKEYLRRRVTRLEAQATSFRNARMAGSFADVAQIMQQACTTLGLPEEAERCAIVREIADARRDDPTGYIAKTRHLDGLYTRLARDPNDAAARAALETVVPSMLASQRIIRAGSLALIGGVDYLRQPLISEQVARVLVEAEPGNHEVIHGAVSRLFYCVYHAIERGEPLGDDHIRLLDRAVSHLERLADSPDPVALDEMTGVANGLDLYLSANLSAAYDHRLIDPIVRVSALGSLGVWDPPTAGFGYTAVVPLRLIARGDHATAELLLDRIDRARCESGVRVETAQAIQLALARAELLLLGRGSASDRPAALPVAIAHLAHALDDDPSPTDRERAHEFHAHALARLAELAAEQGDRGLLDAVAARSLRLRDHALALDNRVRAGYLDDAVRHCEALRAAVPPDTSWRGR